MTAVTTKIDIPQSEIDHYRSILENVRLPDKPLIPGSEEDPSFGTSLAQLKAGKEQLLAIDWREEEKEINKFHHFTAEIEHANIHFVHEKSVHANAIPLILLHGWPFSFLEYRRVIEPLINPPQGQQAFHVVVPSLPGVFLSSVIPDKKHGIDDVARVFNTLMVDVLGYSTYGAHGGDFGGVNIRAIQLNHSATCKLLHFSGFPAPQPADWVSATDTPKLPGQEQILIAMLAHFQANSTAYKYVQSTELGSLAYGVYDGFGMASWLLGKYHGVLNMAIPPPEEKEDIWKHILITLLMYQYTHSSHTSMLMYRQSVNSNKGIFEIFSPPDDDSPRSPMGVSFFAGEFFNAPKPWIECSGNLVFHKYHPEGGGHIPGMVQPNLLVGDIRELFTTHWNKS